MDQIESTPFAGISVRLPDYLDPDKRSAVGQRNDLAYEVNRAALQAELGNLSLPSAVKCLHAQQMDAGQITDDLSQVRYFQCPGPGESYFIGQYNPTRAKRMHGSGRSNPPRGVETRKTPSTKCFLCTDNDRWQSRGVQLYYQIKLNGNTYNVLCNPFPFMPTHVTIAADEHEPQSWHRKITWEGDKIHRLASDLYELAHQLPGFVCFYNGVGAGASIEDHFHFQAFKPNFSHGLFPLQKIAADLAARNNSQIIGVESGTPVLTIAEKDYPLTAFRVSGEREAVVNSTVDWIKRWSKAVDEDASANITAIWENGALALYLIPRNRSYSRSIGLAGIVGGLEVLGEFIFCTEEENLLINAQKIDFDYMTLILRGVRPPNINRLSKDYGR